MLQKKRRTNRAFQSYRCNVPIYGVISMNGKVLLRDHLCNSKLVTPRMWCFWNMLYFECAGFGMCSLFGMCSFRHLLFFECVLFGMCPFWHVLFSACALFSMCSFWHVFFPACALFVMCSFRHELFLSCALFGMCFIWNLLYLEWRSHWRSVLILITFRHIPVQSQIEHMAKRTHPKRAHSKNSKLQIKHIPDKAHS